MRLRGRLGAKVGIERCFVHLLEVFTVGVGYCDVVVEFSAAEDETFAPGSSLPKKALRIIREDGEDQLVERFGRGRGRLLRLRVGTVARMVRRCLENYSVFAAA